LIGYVNNRSMSKFGQQAGGITREVRGHCLCFQRQRPRVALTPEGRAPLAEELPDCGRKLGALAPRQDTSR
jgi:hypothetical protein